jgi:hypothetical protein
MDAGDFVLEHWNLYETYIEQRELVIEVASRDALAVFIEPDGRCHDVASGGLFRCVLALPPMPEDSV